MNLHGAVDLGALKAKSETEEQIGRFFSEDIEKWARASKGLRMYAGGWPTLLNWEYPDQGGAIVAKNTYTTIADICNAQSPFIPANTLKTGTILRITAWGTVGSAAGTATTTMGLYLNGAASGTQIAITASQTPATSTVNCWYLEAQATILTIGSSGTMSTIGNVTGIGTTATTPVIMPATLPAAAAVNTTQANSITVAASWSVSAAGNTYSVYGFTVEQLN
jgi:hypothetical protein